MGVGLPLCCVHERKIHEKAGSRSFGGLEIYAAPVLVDDAPRHAQAQIGPFAHRPSREKRLENTGADLGRDARSGVGHDQPNVIRCQRTTAPLVQAGWLSAHADAARSVGGVQRIHDQVSHDLLDLDTTEQYLLISSGTQSSKYMDLAAAEPPSLIPVLRLGRTNPTAGTRRPGRPAASTQNDGAGSSRFD
jgi:hypothetical protein